MKALLLAAGLALAALVTPAADSHVFSPGPLAQAHAALDQGGMCARCHEPGRRIGARLCTGCHEEAHAATATMGPCETCHVEHLGRGARLVRGPIPPRNG